jgi:hypothetical protein
MVHQIKLRDEEHGLSRLIAGYSWEWISNKNKDAYDIEIEGLQLRWNSTSTDWINSENALNEVGCIHTTQGYDLNYAGIIFGNEISYDKANKQIIIKKENYFDKNGKQSIVNPDELTSYVVNIYKTLMLRGIKGTYIYVCDEDLREYLSQYISKTEKKKEVLFSEVEFENSIPVYNLNVGHGEFGAVSSGWTNLPSGYSFSTDYFACIFIGDSMNKVIPNGSICLFRKCSGVSVDGQIVLVEQKSLKDPDFGSCYTIREYQSVKITNDEHIKSNRIFLQTLSNNMSDEESIQDNKENPFKIIATFECIL